MTVIRPAFIGSPTCRVLGGYGIFQRDRLRGGASGRPVGENDSREYQGSESQSTRDAPRQVQGTDVEHVLEQGDRVQERNERLAR